MNPDTLSPKEDRMRLIIPGGDGMVARIGNFVPTLPRKRMGDPAQLDSSLLYLVAPSSEFVTGTILKVDDGQGSR